MASIDSDDDCFLAPPQIASSTTSPAMSLKRLTKKKKKKNRNSSVSLFSTHQDASPERFPDVGLTLSSPGSMSTQRSDNNDGDSRDSFSPPALDGYVSECSDDDELMPEVEIEQGDYKHVRVASDAEKDGSDDSKSVQDDDHGDGDSDCDSEDEFVDEDDELAVLNLLDKRRNSEARKPDSATEAPLPIYQTEEQHGINVGKKKMKASDLEEIHAASQRLLRETPNASFKPHVLSAKPISSVLEKIRLRKLQLSQGLESRNTHQIPRKQTSASTVDLEALNEDSNLLKKMVSSEEASADLNDPCAQENEGKIVSTPVYSREGDASNAINTPERQTEKQPDIISSATILGIKNPFREPMEDTQDLFSHSQSSQEDVHFYGLRSAEDCNNGIQNASVNLHFDTETQEDYGNWQDADDNKENMAPAGVPVHIDRGPSIRALIDDEAEDEDEDELGLEDDEEEDDGHGLGDMIVEETQEKKAEARKRAELHRKWLEQQDSVTTDDILLRLKSGWKSTENRKRGLEFLADDDDIHHIPLKQSKRAQEHVGSDNEDEMPDEKEDSRDSAVLNGEDLLMEEEAKRFNTFEDVDDAHESSDDEEREHRIMRERFLQDSEKQGTFMSPADDETSREVFVLINKVNIASKSKKLRAGSVDLRIIGGGASNSNSNSGFKASFLRRKTTSGFNSAQKQKKQGSNSSSGTRSFIFGRDDSNSSHGFADHQQREAMVNKENLEPPSLLATSSSSFIMKKVEATPTRKSMNITSRLSDSPSLFEILRGQSISNNDAHSPHILMQKKSLEISPIFSAFRPTKAATVNRPLPK